MKFGKNLTNKEVSNILKSVASALIIKKKNRFRIISYQRAAAAIIHSSIEVKDLWDDNKLTEIPGVGKNIASHLDELFKTGEVKLFNQLFKSLPEAMFEFIKVPGIGPKVAYKLSTHLGINKAENSLARLKQLAKQGKIRKIEGFGKKSEKEILQGLKEYEKRGERILLPTALNIANKIIAHLKKNKYVKRADVLGSLRRMTTTVGDIDISVASKNPKQVIDWFIKYPKKIRVIESGEAKASILITGNYQIDLRVDSLDSYGALLQHFTGSKQHNIHLRKIAQEKNMSLSEYGIKKISNTTKTRLFKYKTEKEFYKAIGLEWIPPELREDMGEIEAAINNKLPKLIKLTDIKGDLHIHSDFNIETSHDIGIDNMENIIKKAKQLNYQYIAFAEHNPSQKNHNPSQIISIIKRKKDKIDKLNYSHEKIKKKYRQNLFIFNSLEIDIKPNGQRALPDKALDYLDFAIVAIHSSFKIDKTKMTKRILKALDHPKIKILAHPTGRMLNKREAYELDWEKIFEFCLKNNKILEINSYPDRLDLPSSLVKDAIKYNIKLIINTDSHELSDLDNMKYGVSAARKGWATKKDITNTLSYAKILGLLKNK